MSFEQNKQKIKNLGINVIYLIDSSAYIKFEEIEKICGHNTLNEIDKLPNYYYLISNEAWIELANGPRNINWKIVNRHIINTEGSMDKNLKENKFLIEREGKLSYMVLNKISSVDYNQILLCQNHPELILVSNDRKMLRSSAVILHSRAMGVPTSINQLAKKFPDNNTLNKILRASKETYEIKKA